MRTPSRPTRGAPTRLSSSRGARTDATLKYGIKNAVAVEGTEVPDAVAALTAGERSRRSSTATAAANSSCGNSRRSATLITSRSRPRQVGRGPLTQCGDVAHYGTKSVETVASAPSLDSIREEMSRQGSRPLPTAVPWRPRHRMTPLTTSHRPAHRQGRRRSRQPMGRRASWTTQTQPLWRMPRPTRRRLRRRRPCFGLPKNRSRYSDPQRNRQAGRRGCDAVEKVTTPSSHC